MTTLAGRRLTLLNPAYMTRQIAEITGRRRGITIRLTSLKPLRPENGPDPWERPALEELGRGGEHFGCAPTGCLRGVPRDLQRQKTVVT